MSLVSYQARILILYGGFSREREISLKSGRAVYDALAESFDSIDLFDVDVDDDELFRQKLRALNPDFVFITLHGQFGEDGRVQAILEDLNIPYTGSNAQVSAITIDKIRTQKLLLNHNISVPRHVVVTEESGLDEIISQIPGPWIIKPPKEGSSLGVVQAFDQTSLSFGVKQARAFDQHTLVEELIVGRELTVGLLGEQILPVLEIIAPDGFYDFKAKYVHGTTRYEFPEDLSDSIKDEIHDMAKRVFKVLGCVGFARVDMILSQDRLFVIEVNTIPGLTEKSLLPKAAVKLGINFKTLCEKILETAYAQTQESVRYILQD